MIVQTITEDYHFWYWLKESGNYKNKFSLVGAVAVQEWYEQLSDSLGTHVEFDPIAWCCEWTEYDNYTEVWNEYGRGKEFIEGEELAIDDNIKLWLENNTQIIELDNGHVLVKEF